MERECVNEIGRVKMSMDSVAVEGEMQIITKELMAEKGNHRMLVARLCHGEGDDDTVYVVASWKNVDEIICKNADKADDVQRTKTDEG